MPDTLEIKAVKRMMRWVSVLTAMVITTKLPDQDIKMSFNDPYSIIMLRELFAFHNLFEKQNYGFSFINDRSFDGIFMPVVFQAELNSSPWGKALDHLAYQKPKKGNKAVQLSQLPYCLLPQECIVTGKSLELTTSTYRSVRGSKKGKIKLIEADNAWRNMSKVIQGAKSTWKNVSNAKDLEAYWTKNRENFSIFWDAYKVIVEKLDAPYTPRYALFDECKKVPLVDIFMMLFLHRVGRDNPIKPEEVPAIFSPDLAGKRLTDFEDMDGRAVYQSGEYGPENLICLRQLDDYFICNTSA